MRCNQKARKQVTIPVDWRKKLTCRSQSHQLKRKGIIQQKPCFICQDDKSHMVHLSYDDPKDVMWMCKVHAGEFRKNRRANQGIA